MIRNLLIATALAFSAAAVQASPLLTCTELGSSQRVLQIDATAQGVEAHLEGRAIAGTSSQGTYRFAAGNWQTPDFLSLELKRVNGRYIGVLAEPARQGNLPFAESVFKCAEAVEGAASSNGF